MVLMEHLREIAVHNAYEWNRTQRLWSLYLQLVNVAPSVSRIHYYGNCVGALCPG